jgi:hypothetical protein
VADVTVRQPSISSKRYRWFKITRPAIPFVGFAGVYASLIRYPYSTTAFIVGMLLVLVFGLYALYASSVMHRYLASAVPGHILSYNAYANRTVFQVRPDGSYDELQLFLRRYGQGSEPPLCSITVQSAEDPRNKHTIVLPFEQISAMQASGALLFEPPVTATREEG